MGEKINLQNCIEHQRDLGFHPKFWEKPESEIREALERKFEQSVARVQELSSLGALNIHERGLLESSRTFLRIAQYGNEMPDSDMERWQREEAFEIEIGMEM